MLLLFQAVQSQGVSDDFWNNPNVIWKTNSGTVITGSFAKKMHLQGNYSFEERPIGGVRLEVKMIPPGKKSTSKIDWRNPQLRIVDENQKPIPLEVAKSLMRVISGKWKIDTLESKFIVLTIQLTSSISSKWVYVGSESIMQWIEKWKDKPLPYFSLKNQYDETVTSSSLLGKVIVINFWNTTCQQCRVDMPELNKVKEVFMNEEVVFLAPNYEGFGTVELFLNDQQFDYQVLSSAQALLDKLDMDFFPSHLIVDNTGKIRDINVGGGSRIGEEIGKKLSWLVYE